MHFLNSINNSFNCAVKIFINRFHSFKKNLKLFTQKINFFKKILKLIYSNYLFIQKSWTWFIGQINSFFGQMDYRTPLGVLHCKPPGQRSNFAENMSNISVWGNTKKICQISLLDVIKLLEYTIPPRPLLSSPK